MRQLLSIIAIIFISQDILSQNGYPVPQKTKTHLFYIQHSNNHNTYVYDANIKNDKIDSAHPIKEYRIVYTQNGKIKPLSTIQRKFAYGMQLISTKNKTFQLKLAASNKLLFTLEHTIKEQAKIYVIINKRKMYLDKMYVQLAKNTSGLKAKAEYILFYGKDYNTNADVTEKLVIN